MKSNIEGLNNNILLTVKEAAELMNRDERTIRHYLLTGQLKGIKMGREWRVIKPDFKEFIKYIKKRRISTDLDLMESAKEEILILGINALGPLHQGREILLDKLLKGIDVKVLILSIYCEEFKKREIKEEFKNNVISGRLKAEYIASISICRDINNFNNKKYTNPGSLEVRCHKEEPICAAVIVDPTGWGCCSLNKYPDYANTRGLMGNQNLYSNSVNTEIFIELLNYFNSVWNSADIVDLSIK